MLNIAGNGLSLMKYDMMAQVLRTNLLVQFIRWLQKYQLRHSHSDKGTIYIIYFESSGDNVRTFCTGCMKGLSSPVGFFSNT